MTARFVLTVDTEDFFEPRPPFDTYRAEIEGTAFGAPLIMDLLEQNSGRGTFFVDVYNRRTVSEDTVRRTCIEVAQRGHEVALHTHPAFPHGQRGYGMAQTMGALSLAEQTKFVRHGVDLLTQWTGTRPATHRAGGYGANYDTLRALAANQVFVDSTFHGYPNCGLNEPPLCVNRPVRWEGVLEIPVTVTLNRFAVGGFGRHVTLASMVKKIDPDWCSPQELRRQIAGALSSGLDPIILFLHSYSLLDIDAGFRPSRRAINVLGGLLSDIRNTFRGKLVTLREAAAGLDVSLHQDELPPEVEFNLTGAEWRTGLWLMRNLRPRHIKILMQTRTS